VKAVAIAANPRLVDLATPLEIFGPRLQGSAS